MTTTPNHAAAEREGFRRALAVLTESVPYLDGQPADFRTVCRIVHGELQDPEDFTEFVLALATIVDAAHVSMGHDTVDDRLTVLRRMAVAEEMNEL